MKAHLTESNIAATPTTHINPPMASNRTGPGPSIHHPQQGDSTTNTPPYAE
jgi:hypothetical protein